MKKFYLSFEGYYLYDYLLSQYNNDLYKNSADYAEMKVPGIYCFYKCKDDKIKELIYIGKAADIYHRLAKHNKIKDFIMQLRDKERLCVSFAEVRDAYDRERVENAMIYKHNPVCNIAGTGTFGYPKTEVILSGKTALLNTRFTVG